LQSQRNTGSGDPDRQNKGGLQSRAANNPLSSRARVLRFARNHSLILLLALVLFAGVDAWSVRSGLGLAQVLCAAVGAAVGVIFATLMHEWFHYLGARLSRATIRIPSRQRLFIYHWDFSRNSPGQFLTMSIAGTIGGVLAVVLIGVTLPTDTWGRAAVLGGAVAGVVYSAMIEWPVIQRTRISAEPLAELSKIDKPLLTRSFLVASLCGIALTASLMF
jgi:hypothetical protein